MGMRKTHWISCFLALLIAGFFAFLEYQRERDFLSPSADSMHASRAAVWMQRAEWTTYDSMFKFRGNQKPLPEIAIIAVDEPSLQQLKQWPWSRGVHAKLIQTLKKDPPKALVFDIFFVDPFTSDPAGDRALAKAT